MDPFQTSTTIDPFTHMCPPFPYPHMQWKYTINTNDHVIFRCITILFD